MSETSVAGSMRTRLAEHSPAVDAVLGKEASFGAFTVTMMWQGALPDLTDLMGRCVVVLTTARKGDTHGGCVMGEDAVVLLGQSAGGFYVLRGVRVTAWVAMVKELRSSKQRVPCGRRSAGRSASRAG